jgi:ubiquinone/menaquinone biosynthesis C-methylase UbiE
VSSEYIHGKTDPREVRRLEKQAAFLSPRILSGFDADAGMSVLDLATGVGAMAGVLLHRFPGIRLTGLDLNPDQLRYAVKNHPGPSYVRATGGRMPFADATFDRVHCSWMLEHVPDPVPVLKEVRRVLKPAGYCHFTEVENSTLRLTPEIREVTEVMNALNEAQIKGGGDPFIGRRLESLFQQAGFGKVTVVPSVSHGTAADLPFFKAFVEEFAEIFLSLDEALGPEMTEKLRTAAQKLNQLPSLPGSEIYYQAVIAQGFR